ncbi:UNVERIFIED_CONTAM: hypothetical protein K2H54_072213 [Gekko kuhli]
MKRPCEETTSESDMDETIDVGSENNYSGFTEIQYDAQCQFCDPIEFTYHNITDYGQEKKKRVFLRFHSFRLPNVQMV